MVFILTRYDKGEGRGEGGGGETRLTYHLPHKL